MYLGVPSGLIQRVIDLNPVGHRHLNANRFAKKYCAILARGAIGTSVRIVRLKLYAKSFYQGITK